MATFDFEESARSIRITTPTKASAPYFILKQHGLLLDRMKDFSPPREFKKFRVQDDRQMGLFTEEASA